MDDKPDHSARGHSPLGASGAERWMNCAGSVALITRMRELLKAMGIPEEDDPDYRREGTAMHEAAAYCLERKLDTWEIVGQTFNETVIDQPMADAIQAYLDYVAQFIGLGWTYYIEYGISSPIHPDFYGTCDFGAIGPGVIRVVDLKGGEGIMVDAYQNPQLRYYAYGMIEGIEAGIGHALPDDTPVLLAICQPRITWTDSPIREWATTVGETKSWVHEELVPAMIRTSMDSQLEAGPWCRFCPANLICPLLTGLFRAACVANPKELVNLDNDRLGLNYLQLEAVTFYVKALKDEAFRRLNLGQTVPGTKLVQKKANRVFSSDAQPLAKARFGAEAFTLPALKTPAELEKLSPAAAEFVKEHAYTPNTGVTVALESDPKAAVIVKRPAEAFAGAVQKLVDGSGQTG